MLPFFLLIHIIKIRLEKNKFMNINIILFLFKGLQRSSPIKQLKNLKIKIDSLNSYISSFETIGYFYLLISH